MIPKVTSLWSSGWEASQGACDSSLEGGFGVWLNPNSDQFCDLKQVV